MGEIGPGDEHARARHQPLVDRIAQGNVGEPAIGADIAHGGEARLERQARIPRADQHGIDRRGLERVGQIRAAARVGEVGVEVDQAGEDGVGRPVDPCRALGRGGAGLDPEDAVPFGEDALPGQHLTCLDIEQSARLEIEPIGQRGDGSGQRQEGGGGGSGPHFEESSVSSRR